MDLWTWLARTVVDQLKERFERLTRQRNELAELARRAHADAGQCDGRGLCKFCDKLAAALEDE